MVSAPKPLWAVEWEYGGEGWLPFAWFESVAEARRYAQTCYPLAESKYRIVPAD